MGAGVSKDSKTFTLWTEEEQKEIAVAEVNLRKAAKFAADNVYYGGVCFNSY
jgi:hypothetical protein